MTETYIYNKPFVEYSCPVVAQYVLNKFHISLLGMDPNESTEETVRWQKNETFEGSMSNWLQGCSMHFWGKCSSGWWFIHKFISQHCFDKSA